MSSSTLALAAVLGAVLGVFFCALPQAPPMLAYLLILSAVMGIYFGAANLYDWCLTTKRAPCYRNMRNVQMVAQVFILLLGMAGAYRYALRGKL